MSEHLKLKILRYLVQQESPKQPRTIAYKTEIPLSTANKAIKTLRDDGLITSVTIIDMTGFTPRAGAPKRGRKCLAWKISDLGAEAANDSMEKAA